MRALAFRLVIALAALALPPMAPVAAGQVLNFAPLDLRGTWELEERGERLDPANPLVQITQNGDDVMAEFLTGARCKDQHQRNFLFVGAKLRRLPTMPGAPELWTLSSDNMLACTGSYNDVAKCNGSIPTHYITNFTNATAERDRISGSRMTLGRMRCTSDAAYNGSAQFTLTRARCELEALMVNRRDNEFSTIVANTFIPAIVAFRAAIDAARRRFGDRYGGLSYPYEHMKVAIDDVVGTEALAHVLPDTLTDSDWIAARQMAAEMGLAANPPLIEAQRMLEHMNLVEQKAPDARRAIGALSDARDALKKCREALQ